MIKIRGRRSKENVITMAVAGVNKGVGVTHMCLTIANYLYSKEGYDVIYIEMADTSDLIEVVEGKQVRVGNTVGYQYLGVNYVFTSSMETIREILLFSKCPVIVDIKNFDEDANEIFGLCNKKYIIGSMRAWCRKDYIRFIRNKIIRKHDMKQIRFYMREMKKDEKRQFNDEFGGILRNIPNIENPFKIREKEFNIISDIIW